MRKIIALITAAVMTASLSGCNNRADAKKGGEAIVASLGFDLNKGAYSVFFETVTVNSEDPSEPKRIEVVEGVGTTLSAAIEDIYKKAVRSFLFSHCSAAVLGDGINQKAFREIRRFIYEKDEINIALRFINSKTAKELLSCERRASVALGYDLIDTLEEQSDIFGVKYKDGFYDIEAAEKEGVNVIAIPYFEVKDKSYSVEGVTVYKDYSPVLRLSENESEVYSLLTNRRKKGNFFYNKKIHSLTHIDVEYDFFYGTELEFDVEINLKFAEKSKIAPAIEETARSLFKMSKKVGADIFGFGNILAMRRPEIWANIKHGYYEEYLKSSLEVDVSEE